MRLDRLVALAWMQEENEKCPGCQRPWTETSDPEAFEDYEVTPIVCHACAERERHRRKYERSDMGAPDGLYLSVHQREDVILGQ